MRGIDQAIVGSILSVGSSATGGAQEVRLTGVIRKICAVGVRNLTDLPGTQAMSGPYRRAARRGRRVIGVTPG
jgi:hypothetical protein